MGVLRRGACNSAMRGSEVESDELANILSPESCTNRATRRAKTAPLASRADVLPSKAVALSVVVEAGCRRLAESRPFDRCSVVTEGLGLDDFAE